MSLPSKFGDCEEGASTSVVDDRQASLLRRWLGTELPLGGAPITTRCGATYLEQLYPGETPEEQAEIATGLVVRYNRFLEESAAAFDRCIAAHMPTRERLQA